MKVCEICGDEISTRDGDNVCSECEAIEEHNQRVAKEKQAKANKQRREREKALRDIGLVKVRGAMGGTYWE